MDPPERDEDQVADDARSSSDADWENAGGTAS
jgi:hypothetical protein